MMMQKYIMNKKLNMPGKYCTKTCRKIYHLSKRMNISISYKNKVSLSYIFGKLLHQLTEDFGISE